MVLAVRPRIARPELGPSISSALASSIDGQRYCRSFAVCRAALAAGRVLTGVSKQLCHGDRQADPGTDPSHPPTRRLRSLPTAARWF